MVPEVKGSIREVKSMVDARAYPKIKDAITSRKEFWYIVGFTASTLVLRIDQRNIEFDRSTGRVKSHHDLRR